MCQLCGTVFTDGKTFDIHGVGEGEGLYNLTRSEIEQLMRDIRNSLQEIDGPKMGAKCR